MPRCTRCPGRPGLRLTQPDDGDYVRILATCPDCGRWYLRLQPPGGRATLHNLPVPTLDELGVRIEDDGAAIMAGAAGPAHA